jgi:vancomycin resistance protein YoaR
MGPLKPRLTTQWARSTGITSLLGTYTTKYDSGATSRVNNIHLLLRQLNNTFVRPRGTFSFNKTIGPRTAEKGYEEAPAIIGGRLVPSLGGGVCQVGTTLFNAVFFSGLDVVERHNHSFYISHYPDGRDATVSWDGPDLKFRNDTPAWVMIKAWWGEDWVTISLYGPKVDNEVAYTTSDFTDFIDPPMEHVEDPAMQVGKTEIEDEGIRGRNITVKRTVTRNGKVIHRDVFASHYQPKVGIVRVGVKPKPKPKPTPSKETSPAAAP